MKHSVTLSLTFALVACSQMESLALAEAAPKQPNIVLLISDDDDYEHFGFMGSKIAHTPTLDKFAAAGTLFTTAHCPAPLCRPSLASMLSGRLPHQHGIYSNYLDKRGIGSDRTRLNPNGSLANRLKDAGYATYASGKYWEGDPRAMGFTHGTVDVTFKGFSQFVRKGQDELFQFIDEQHETKPMFIWWAPLVPHLPHNPPSKYMDRFSDVEIPIPSFYKGDREKYVAGMRKFYAMGTWFDDGVAQLIKKLKAAGEYENTLFLFYVDNGWAIGMPAKNSPSEKGLRTPMFVTWPGKVPASKRIDSLNYVLDLHATALDYAGLKVPADIASKSLRSQIDGKTSKPHEILFGAVYSHNAWAGDPSVKRSAERDMLAIYARTDQWKYVIHTQDINQKNVRLVNVNFPLPEPYYRQKGEQYLFDLHADPYEQNNLAGQSSQKERVVELRRQTLDWWKRTGGGPLEVAELNPSATSKNASGAAPRAEEDFFNGKDLSGWKAKDMSFWSVKDGAIVGTAGKKPIPGNKFLWHKTPVSDFYLSLKVKHAPYSANAGIQFRSAQTKTGAAHGYQADVGEGWWGTLFHEHGRKILARSADVGEKNIRREDWNHYEILAVGQRIWLAINGKITVALRDRFGESDGHIAVQIHGGPPQTVAYKDFKLIHSPKVELLGMGEEALNRLLVDALKEGMPIPKKKKARNPEKEKADHASKQNKPNVVIMMVDDMGFAGPSIAPYGNPHYKTPGMDRLALEGMLFTDFHSSGTVCSSTRAGLLTGRYQQRVGIEAVIHPHATHPEHRKGLQKSEITFAELFKQAG
ncbi:MAG: sulfatase-like hydrolase/transferase, partial [Alphaproteobacteria bacterium]|nr:sulfatase-like hydrolase/transferase [Alphaproteobacteria bacterium]